jgi:hypothetical protein
MFHKRSEKQNGRGGKNADVNHGLTPASAKKFVESPEPLSFRTHLTFKAFAGFGEAGG